MEDKHNNGMLQSLLLGGGSGSGGDNRFLVNCTPTALDYSGTMDHTVAEIYAAYQAGKTIVFRVWASLSRYMDAVSTFIDSQGDTYPSINAYVVYDSDNALIEIWTGTTNDGTKAIYGTNIYPLSTK